MVLNQLKKTLLIIGFLLGLGLIWIYFSFSPIENQWFPKCPFHTLTSLYCPGCGSQRAIHASLNGHFLEAIKHNALIIVLIVVLLYDWTIKLINHYSNRTYYNLLYSSKTTLSILIIVILFWILRNIDCYPFSILAP